MVKNKKLKKKKKTFHKQQTTKTQIMNKALCYKMGSNAGLGERRRSCWSDIGTTRLQPLPGRKMSMAN